MFSIIGRRGNMSSHAGGRPTGCPPIGRWAPDRPLPGHPPLWRHPGCVAGRSGQAGGRCPDRAGRSTRSLPEGRQYRLLLAADVERQAAPRARDAGNPELSTSVANPERVRLSVAEGEGPHSATGADGEANLSGSLRAVRFEDRPHPSALGPAVGFIGQDGDCLGLRQAKAGLDRLGKLLLLEYAPVLDRVALVRRRRIPGPRRMAAAGLPHGHVVVVDARAGGRRCAAHAPVDRACPCPGSWHRPAWSVDGGQRVDTQAPGRGLARLV